MLDTPDLRRTLPLKRTVADLFVNQLEQSAKETLITVDGTAVTYRDFEDRILKAIGLLEAWGVKAGDRIIVVSENRIEPLELFMACAFTGSIYVPINPHLRGRQLEHQIRDADPTQIVVERDYEGAVGAAAQDIGWSGDPIVLGEGYWEGAEPLPGRIPKRNLLPTGAPDQPIAVLYTSGTTGPSKGVICPQGQFFWWAVNVAEYLELSPSDVLFTTLPIYHVNALGAFLQAMSVGACLVLRRGFSASRFIDDLRSEAATVTYLLGAMVSILYEQEPSQLDDEHDVRVVLAPGTPPRLWEPFQKRFGMALVEGFGMTELNLVICARVADQRGGNMGWPIDGFEIDVVDEDDHSVEGGSAGELVVRPVIPHSISQGYWRNPEATVRAWKNLWFHTGDRVRRLDDGSIQFVDRKKDAIRRRGENISSFEVEGALSGHPAVAEVACFGVPSQLGEEEVMVCVVPQGPDGVDIDGLVSWAERSLAYFAVPRFIEVVDELPRTANGKIRKSALRERGITGQTIDIAALGRQPKR